MRSDRRRSPVPAALLLIAAVAVGLVGREWTATSTTTSVAAPGDVVLGHVDPPPAGEPQTPDPSPGRLLGVADGVLPEGTVAFDDEPAGIAELDPALLAALRRATTDAAREGVELVVNSGWRSRDLQEQLFRDAVAEYGSTAEAARWVAAPDRSAHVFGDAVDVGPPDAAGWLGRRGAAYGLCRTYRNEPWHFELRTDAVERGCPRPYADPTDDPRMES